MSMTKAKLPPGWDDARVQRVLKHYDSQSEDDAVREDEAMRVRADHTLVAVPNDLVPVVRELIAKHRS